MLEGIVEVAGVGRVEDEHVGVASFLIAPVALHDKGLDARHLVLKHRGELLYRETFKIGSIHSFLEGDVAHRHDVAGVGEER